MASAYTTVEIFKGWLPQRYLAELTDDTGGFEITDTFIEQAMEWASGFFESHLNVRTDIRMPAVNEDGSVNPEIREAIHDLTLFRLFVRRGYVPDEIQLQFTMQRDWLRDVASRRANIHIIGKHDRIETKVNDQPVTDGTRENKFDDFTFG